jgi:membrane protein implicated in regulation of membrane protease activity
MVPLLTIYINPWSLALAIIIVIAVLALIVILVVRAHERKVTTGSEELVGRTAIVRTALDPKGRVFIEDELWSAEIDKGTAQPEEEVVITKVDGLKLYVTKK